MYYFCYNSECMIGEYFIEVLVLIWYLFGFQYCNVVVFECIVVNL